MSPSKPPGPERRRDPRAALEWPVTINLPDGPHEARLRDVSRAGLCFYLDRRLPEMTVLSLDLDLPLGENGGDACHVRGNGVVVRCRPISPLVDHYEVAVFLNDIAEEDRERLEAFVAAEV